MGTRKISTKTEEIRVLLTPEWRESLDDLRGIIPISAYIRSLIERAWAERERGG